MPRPSFLARLRAPRRPEVRRHHPTVGLVGSDAQALAGLRDAGVEVRAPADAEVVLVLDPDVHPVRVPRRPVRIGIVARGQAPRWAPSDAVEDVDALVVTTDRDADAVRPRTLRPPVRATDPVGGALDVAAELGRLPRLHLVTGVSNLRMRPRWGDHHYAVAIAKALARHGWWTRTWTQAELPEVDHGPAAAVLLLAGGLDLTPVPGRPTIAWVIYPRDLDTDALRQLDHVHVASPTVAADLRAAGVTASVLFQATDTTRFRPTPGGRHHRLLFVANSRNVRRRITDDLLPTSHELAIYGYGWTPELVDTRHVVADHVPNQDLPALYTAADVVLNDHWDEMRAGAYLSNRLFDAAACGAAVVTDRVPGLDDVFGDAVRAYDTPADLHATIDALLADPGLRRELGDRARDVVVGSHTFDHRVETLLASLPAGARP